MPRSKHTNGARKGSVKSRTRSDFAFPCVAKVEPLTPERAAAFVRLLHAGLPAADAVAMILPTATDEQVIDTVSAWGNNPVTLAALAEFSRGKWQDLEPEARLTLARDKWLAEQAYFLYTHNFSTIDPSLMGSAKYAYASLCEFLGSRDQVDDPVAKFMAMMKDAYEKKTVPATHTVSITPPLSLPAN